jgi:phospholipid/cholesterol/gamma-HCH transport system substrate-binding protein
MMRRIPALVKGLAIVGIFAVGVTFAIKAAYGAYGHYYYVTMNLPRAGQQLETGSDVRERGVVIGRVHDISLAGRQVRVTLQIDAQYKVPDRAQAFITLKTLLGSKYIDLRSDRFAAPYLPDGGSIQVTHIGPELEDALADGVQVLDAIRPNDLATIIHELATAARGHGETIARSLRANAELSGVFRSTLGAQLQGLHDFRVIFGALRDKGVDLNRLADAINQGVPVYASPKAQALLDQALRAIQPFSQNLGDLLTLNRADWDRMIDNGDVVLGTIARHPEGLARLIHGLWQYVDRLGGPPPRLDDGSAAAPFVGFIGGNSDAENRRQICEALPVDLRKQIPLCNGTL